jgi:hypothetical protein
VIMYAINGVKLLRVSREGEIYGLDLHEHGISAYPEYVISAMGSPAGLSSSGVSAYSSTPVEGINVVGPTPQFHD